VIVVQHQLSNFSATMYIMASTSLFRPPRRVEFFFIVLAHWNNSFLCIWCRRKQKTTYL